MKRKLKGVECNECHTCALIKERDCYTEELPKGWIELSRKAHLCPRCVGLRLSSAMKEGANNVSNR